MIVVDKPLPKNCFECNLISICDIPSRERFDAIRNEVRHNKCPIKCTVDDIKSAISESKEYACTPYIDDDLNRAYSRGLDESINIIDEQLKC